MGLCLSCAVKGRQPNCSECLSLTAVPPHVKARECAEALVRQHRTEDDEAAFVRQQKRLLEAMKRPERRNAWKKKHKHGGVPCDKKICQEKSK